MATVGNILKEKRESLHLTLNDVADATNLSINFLAAIERNEFHVLPRGIFPKMFIKSYANHLGLNADDLVNLYYEQISQAEEEQSGPLLAPASPPIPFEDRPSRIRRPLLILLLLVILGAVFYLTSPQKLFERSEASSLKPSQPPPSPVPPPAPAAAAPVAAPGEPPRAEAKPGLSPTQTELVIVADESCWMSCQWVQDGRNEKIEVTLQPGDRFARVFDGEVKLVLGNAGGVKAWLNGRETLQLGLKGEVKHLPLAPSALDQYFAGGETTP